MTGQMSVTERLARIERQRRESNPYGLDPGYNLRWRKVLKIFSDSGKRLTYDHESGVARSYGWYVLAQRMQDGQFILNDYGYSSTTRMHIYRIRRFFELNDLKIAFEIEAPSGLQDLQASLEHYQGLKEKAFKRLEMPRIRAYTREKQKQIIDECNQKMSLVSRLIEQGGIEHANDGLTEGVVNL